MKLSPIEEKFFLRVINTEAVRTVAFTAALFLLTLGVTTAQDGYLRPSKSEAQAAWDRGSYEVAYEHYNGLLLLYSRDPLYRYYTGACLVKMERDIPRAVSLLGSAITSSVNIKSVPDDVWFYYGRALQMNGSFTQASEAYERFARDAGRKVAAGYEVQAYLDQCGRGEGALSPGPDAASANIVTGATTSGTGSTGAAAATGTAAATTTKSPSATATNDTTPKTNPVNPTTSAPATTPAAANGTTPKATTTGAANPVAATTSNTTGNGAAMKPDQQEGVKKTQVAAAANSATDNDASLAVAVRLQHEADSLLYTVRDTAGAAAIQAKADSLFMALEESAPVASRNDKPQDPVIQPIAPVLSEFEVRQNPAYSEKNPVPVDPVMPPGLVYTLQIAAFRNPVAPSLFRGLFPVYGRKRQDSEATYYYTGFFRRIDDAREALPQARSAGFSDAFIIALMDGTQVSMERAQLLEKEWSEKSLPVKQAAPAGQSGTAPVNAEPVGTLSFRAEVMRSSKPVKPEVIEKIELLAGTRGWDMIKNSNGETVFLIGNFITFESANEYVSLLIRNGYSTARVAAYVGLQEIPVEAAKELLNRLHDD